MIVDFEKWHGAKNDFIVFWMNPSDLELQSLQRQAPMICKRDGSGIGADGLLILKPQYAKGELLPESLTIINSDGSLAATCGNGIRVASLSVLRRFWNAPFRAEVPDTFELALAAGGKVMIRYLGQGNLNQPSRNWPYVSVAMGIPSLDANHAPDRFAAVQREVKRIAQSISMTNELKNVHYVNIGNEHLVFQLEHADRDLLLKVGPALQNSELWDGINVHLAVPKACESADIELAQRVIAAPVEECFQVFVWERGAGETQACGSGACAVAKVAIAEAMMDRHSWVAIDMPGGRLYCQQSQDDDPMLLAGPGELVFTGKFEL